MKIWILIFAMGGFSAHADEATLLAEWKQASHVDLTYASPRVTEARVTAALQATEALLKFRGVATQSVRLPNAQFTALEILPIAVRGASLNAFANRVVAVFPSLRLVYSPYDLMRGVGGFFSPGQEVLGISHGMLESSRVDETFRHEWIHASHHFARRNGALDPLGTVASLDAGARPDAFLSPELPNGYRRLQTFEEGEAYLQSIQTLTEALDSDPKSAADSLNLLNDQLRIAIGILAQTRELSERGSRKLPGSLTWARGNESRGDSIHWQAVLSIDSFATEFSGGRPKLLTFADSARLTWNLWLPTGVSPRFSVEDVRRNLEASASLANRLRGSLTETRATLCLKLDRVDPKCTDLRRTRAAAKRSAELLAHWKREFGGITIPTIP